MAQVPTTMRMILPIISKAKGGATVYEVFIELGSEYKNSIHSLHAHLLQMVKCRRLRRHGKRKCEFCRASHAVYKITEEGRETIRGWK